VRIGRQIKQVHTLRQLEKRYQHLVDLLALGVLAGTLRLWGIGFDLPLLYHRDEAKYVSIPLRILKTGDLNPQFFNYPSLFFYILSLAYIAYFLFMASRGRLGSLDGMTLPEQVLPNVVGRATMPSQFLVGRGVVACAGVLTVLIVYWIVRRAYGRRAGLIAGLLLSISPIHIRNSHFVAPDVVMLLFVVASSWFSYQILLKGKLRDYVLAGLLAGLAASTKYNAFSAIVPLFVAHISRPRRKALLDTDLLWAFVASTVGFFLGTPFALLDLPAFLNGVAFEVRHYALLGDPGTEVQNALLWYAGYLLRTEGPILLLASLETGRGILRRNQKTLFFACFPATYMLLVASSAVKNDRTVLTIVPFLAILAGAFLDRAITFIQEKIDIRRRPRMVSWLSVTMPVLLTLFWAANRTIQIDTRFTQNDVRTQATLWLESELRPGSRIVGEYYSPLLENSVHDFRWVDRAIDQPIAWYQANADYVVFVENRYGGFYLDPSRYPEQIAGYEEMFLRFTLVQEFQGGALGNACHIMVYRVRS